MQWIRSVYSTNNKRLRRSVVAVSRNRVPFRINCARFNRFLVELFKAALLVISQPEYGFPVRTAPPAKIANDSPKTLYQLCIPLPDSLRGRLDLKRMR